MRMRALLRLVLLGSLATLPAAMSAPTASAAGAGDAERQSAALPDIKLAVLNATGYGDAAVSVVLKADQFWVTILNSPLNQSSARQREAQAAQITSAIAEKLKQDSAFATILGIHIDYAARPTGNEHPDIVDSIDLRKGPSGSFEHHTT